MSYKTKVAAEIRSIVDALITEVVTRQCMPIGKEELNDAIEHLRRTLDAGEHLDEPRLTRPEAEAIVCTAGLAALEKQ